MPMKANTEFANYCCELLSSVGPCLAKRMFGGYGISTDGLTIAILADLGDGEKLWLKAMNRRAAVTKRRAAKFSATRPKACPGP